MNFSWDVIWASVPQLLQGAELTAYITLLGIGGGMVIGTLSGLALAFQVPLLRWVLFVYVSVIRGTPIVVQAMFIYFAVPMIALGFGTQLTFSAFTAASVCLALNAGAYITEIIRGAVLSVNRGLIDAALALGLSRRQVLADVVGPIAFRRSVPPLGNQFIISLKDSALFIVIGVGELAQQGDRLVAETGRAIEVWTTVGVIYLAMTFTLAMIMKLIEKRMRIL
ncbi:ABC transporter permease subunit [Ectothiorhodospiraceae bacterium WFHF3C12]|nr:ABC transporter permease subunit [Ectothiorhodospiraceae bacterium WFHF3C12]